MINKTGSFYSLRTVILALVTILIFGNCSSTTKNDKPHGQTQDNTGREVERKDSTAVVLQPTVITEKARYDTDDPAIWINPRVPAESIVIGTDKDKDGALLVYNLKGQIIKRVGGLGYPNNVDVEYGFQLKGESVDIAVCTERIPNKIRVFRLPQMEAIDNGGIDVFSGETHRGPMGIALYKRPTDNAIYAIVSRKTGPKTGYLWQYKLENDGSGNMKANKVREFGNFSGENEIEALAVDDELGYIYCSDETFGIRKYYADPDVQDADKELAILGRELYKKDREGISIYKLDDKTGYILVSDQAAGSFHIYPREGTKDNPHNHPLLKIVQVCAKDSDGSDVTSIELLPDFPGGMFVAMSTDKTFHYYPWSLIAGDDLKSK